ncbi:hypothetical protein Fcan01_23131, partial [Folsomia candida]
SIFLVNFVLSGHLSLAILINPDTFLNSQLVKGLWGHGTDIHDRFEGGWVENKSRNLQPTHICRAKLGQVSIIPGELFNETCYISGNPTLANGGTGVCRKFIYGKGNNLHKSMAVLGNFSPKVGKCFYEMQVKADTMKWDVSFTTEKFELLVSKGKWKEPCGKDVEDLKETE